MKLCAFCVIFLIGAVFSGCSRETEDQKFERLANNAIEEMMHQNPAFATGLGDHRFDNKMGDYSMKGIEEGRKLAALYIDSLKSVRAEELSPVNNTDYHILMTNLEYTIFQTDTLKEYEWNPLSYNFGSAIYDLVSRDFAPLKERLLNAKERIRAIPSVLEAARTNLKNPPKIFTETALLQNGGNIGLVSDEMNSFLEQVPELKAEFKPVQDSAVAALTAYGEWLKNDLLPRSTGDFRLGDAKFRRKLYYALESDLTKEQILESGMRDLKEAQDAMYETALPLFKKYFPKVTDSKTLNDKKKVCKAVLDKLAEDHPTNENIIEKAKKDLETTTAFVREHDLITLPTEPIKITELPVFLRGVAVAYCYPPGPLEKNGETFYYISPTPADWTAKRVASFFREYNDYMLQDLTIHEAMPGHYVQLAHSNQFHAPTMVRAIFGNGPFVEGWATYAEQFMAEEGYGGPEVKMQELKMRLRLIINAIIDQKIHTEGMTEQEAMDLMMNEGFQEEGEAAGKWRRACLSSTQLSTYYVGNLEMNSIRNAYRAKMGDKFNLRQLHDEMLSFGSPAAKYVKKAMGLQ